MNRDLGIKSLETILKKPQNIKIVEEKIFKISSATEDPWETYKNTIYQVVGDVTAGKTLKNIMASLNNNHLDWENEVYDDVRAKILEQDEFTECPFVVEEGVVTCKCGSKRVFSFCKQMKGGDEGTTTKAKCMKCNNEWTEGG